MIEKIQASIEKQRLAGFKVSEISKNLKNEGYKEEDFIPLILSDLKNEAEQLKLQAELLEDANKKTPPWRIILSIITFILVFARMAMRCNNS